MTSATAKNRHTIQSIGQKLDQLFDVVGQVLVEQTAMKDDISELKIRTFKLDNSNQNIRSELSSFRAEFNDFRDETKQELSYIQEDIRVILPNHERRITRLEGRRASAA